MVVLPRYPLPLRGGLGGAGIAKKAALRGGFFWRVAGELLKMAA